MIIPVAMSISKLRSNYGEHPLIPLTVKMVNSAVSTCYRFVLRDGCPLCMVKLVDAVRDYHENIKNITIDVEDETGLVQVIVWHKGKKCKVVLALGCECKGNDYICVIREVTDYYDMKEIMVFDVSQVSSGNIITYHFLEVAYSFEKMMEYAEDGELRAVDFNKLICKHRKAIGKVENGALSTVKYVENEEPSPVDFNRVISKHMQ